MTTFLFTKHQRLTAPILIGAMGTLVGGPVDSLPSPTKVNPGQITQLAATVTGVGTAFVAGNVGSIITWADGSTSTISAVGSATSVTVSPSITKAVPQNFSLNTGGSVVCSAAFELQDTTSGLLHARLTTAQINAIVNPVNGMEVFNLSTGNMVIYQNGFWQNASAGLFVSGTLTAAQVNLLFTTPITVLAAPGAGLMNVVNQFGLELVINGQTVFTAASGGAVYLQYGTTAHGTNYATPVAGVPAAFVLQANTANYAITTGGQINSTTGLTTTIAANAPISITNATAVFAGGAGATVNYYIWYSTVAVS